MRTLDGTKSHADLRWHYSPMRTLASLMNYSQSALTFDLSFQFLILHLRCSSVYGGLRCGCAAARLLGLGVHISPGHGCLVCSECCVLTGSGISVGLITRPQEAYPVWCV